MKLSIRKLADDARRANRYSGVHMNGYVTVMTGRMSDTKLTVRAFGPFCTMFYYIDGQEVSYRDACALIKGSK